MDHAPASSRRISRIASPFVLLLVFGLVLAGCRTSYTVRPPTNAKGPAAPADAVPPSPAPEPRATDVIPFAVAQEHLAAEEATVELRNGRTFPATVVTLRTDGLTVQPDGGEQRTLALDAIHAVTVKKYGRGALQGLGAGLAAGFTAGSMVALHSVLFSASGASFIPLPILFPLAALSAGVQISIVTVPVAGVIGAERAHRNVYYFSPPSASLSSNR